MDMKAELVFILPWENKEDLLRRQIIITNDQVMFTTADTPFPCEYDVS